MTGPHRLILRVFRVFYALHAYINKTTSPLRIKIVLPEDESDHTPNVVHESILIE